MPSAQSKTTFIDPPSTTKEQAEPEREEAEAVEGEHEEAPAVNGEATERSEAEPDAEARARKLGWHPKDEYEKSGRDPEKWVSAEDFMHRQEDPRITRENLRKITRLSEKQAKQLDEGNKLLRDLIASQKSERDKAVKAALSKAEKDRREAITVGDVPEAERLSGEIEGHKEALKAPVPAETEQRVDAKTEIPEEITEWGEANSWFGKDKAMTALATAYYGDLVDDKKLTETERLAKVKAEVVRRFPEKFANPRRSQPSAVEGANGNSSRGRKMDKGWNDLPRDAQDIAERLIRQGAVKDRASYLKDYAW